MIQNDFDRFRFQEAIGDMGAGELAEKLGCPKSLISMYLSGQRKPSKMAIQLIAIILGVNPAWLCGIDIEKNSNVRIVSMKANETELIDLYRSVNNQGRALILANARMIAGMEEYRK